MFKKEPTHISEKTAIIMVIICTLFTSVAQVLYKIGVKNLSFDIMSAITNYPIIGGLALYGVGMIILLIALRGAELTMLYPIMATSYIWVSLMSLFIFHESVGLWRWIGICFIVAGVFYISRGTSSPTPVDGP